MDSSLNLIERGRTLDVFLTVDLECGDYSTSYDGSVFGRLNNIKNKSYGLEYILKILRYNNLNATFFVETLSASKLGVSGLKDACSLILAFGHDIQLHIHPNLLALHEGLTLESKELHQAISSFTLKDQIEMIKYGINTLKKCGVNDVVAFRAGGFGANRLTLKALAACNITIDSSYNAAYLGKAGSFKSLWSAHNLISKIDGIVEVPITNFLVSSMPSIGYRHLQIGATSLGEFKSILLQAANRDFNSVCIFFHTNEFIYFKDKERTVGVPNKKNMQRFERLCQFLCQNNEILKTRPVGDLVKEEGILGEMSSMDIDSTLSVPMTCYFSRIMQQLASRLYCKVNGLRPLG